MEAWMGVQGNGCGSSRKGVEFQCGCKGAYLTLYSSSHTAIPLC